MTESADLLARLRAAVERAVEAGEIGAARSIRLHVGAPGSELPATDALLALGDAIFACPRIRTEHLDEGGTGAALCVWEQGQIATVSTTACDPPLVLLTVLGAGGALHFRQGGG